VPEIEIVGALLIICGFGRKTLAIVDDLLLPDATALKLPPVERQKYL
jgi:hypothetical protein